jgi:hypothetical protein
VKALKNKQERIKTEIVETEEVKPFVFKGKARNYKKTSSTRPESLPQRHNNFITSQE